MKKKYLIFTIILIMIIIIGIIVYVNYSKKEEITPIITESTEVDIEYEEEASYESYTSIITLQDDSSSIDGRGARVSGNTIYITSAGIYYLTGNLNNGNIIIDADSNSDVTLVLSNVNITSQTTAVINGVNANKITITLAENTTNYLTDSSNYSYFTDTTSSEPDATIFSKTDLSINGSGKLIISANYLDGIVSKDILKISNCDVSIISNDDAIRGKDYVGISNATIQITSDGDGIKSTNTEDTSLGFIKIENSDINIETKRDGIQAETIVNISNSNINIETSGQISNTIDDISSKGIKTGTELVIESGIYNINSIDDSLHSNGSLIIKDGTFKLSSSDDAIHADTSIIINGGTIDITNSYEGIESSYIEINDGDINIISSDDGINIAGGNDSSAFGNRPGQNSFNQVGETNQKLVINDGNIYVEAEGDGLDANGSIYINNGKIIIAGPNSGGNSSFDYDNECVISGGTVIAYGSKEMWQNPSNSSTQYGITFNVEASEGDEILVTDDSNNKLVNFTIENLCDVVFVSSSELKKGETYMLSVNGEENNSVTVTNIISGDEVNSMNMPGNGGGKGMQVQGGRMR